MNMQMQKYQKVSLRITIKVDNELTINELEEVIRALNDTFRAYYAQNNIPESEYYVYSPTVTGIRQGSIIFDISMVLLSVSLSLAIEFIKDRLKERNLRCDIALLSHKDSDAVYSICKYIITEYACKQSDLPLESLIKQLSVKTSFDREKLLSIIQRIKYLLWLHRIKNTLGCTKRKTENETLISAFMRVCKELSLL